MELVPLSRSQTALNPLDNEGQITENEDEEAEALLEAIDGTHGSPLLGSALAIAPLIHLQFANYQDGTSFAFLLQFKLLALYCT